MKAFANTLTTFDIKIIAIVCMVVDHVGLYFFPHLLVLRVIGRLAFPLFAYLVANGAMHTKNISAYAKRLCAFAIISQIPYAFVNWLVYPKELSLNVLFTLFLGLIAIMAIQKTKRKIVWGIVICMCAIVAQVAHADYGAIGVVSIICFYFFYTNMQYMIISQAFLFTLMTILKFASIIEPFGLLSLMLIAVYSGKEGRKSQYLFYIFYPAQYVIIFLCLLLIKHMR